MVARERKLTESDIYEISEIYGIEKSTIRSKMKIAESMLYLRLKNYVDLKESF